tara:strand:+ start:747 stop:1736 length:990 start_codon:yes stop_codon:yes gene_type:complete
MALPGIIRNSFYLIILLFLFACTKNQKNQKPTVNNEKVEKKVDVPNFNADSAYFFVEQQVLFGPRAPNSQAHKKCGNYLVAKLEEYGAKIFIQESVEQRFDGEKLNMKNIIGSFSPDKNERIFLCAHWDSRFIADHDTTRTKEAIDGANDGASGVGVLLEIARQASIMKPEIGVDIIFFDLEDQGEGGTGDVLSWCIGSQYWSKKPHVSNYNAEYGILLDMVGAPGAIFTQEAYSVEYAKEIVDKYWNQAIESGFSDYFSFEQTPGIIDDHLPINEILKIPTIDIIEYDPSTENHFNKYWHTHGDGMNNISRETLKAVGQTVMDALYNE